MGMKEEIFRRKLHDLATMYGWDQQYHTYDSRRSGPGWPDEVFAHSGYRRLLFVELKTDTGRVSPEQKEWLTALQNCGCEIAVWRPRDMDDIVSILGPAQQKCPLVSWDEPLKPPPRRPKGAPTRNWNQP